MHLDVASSGNWQDFGKKIVEIPPSKLRQFAKPYSCTEEVLRVVKTKVYPEVTVGKIKEVLTKLGRVDVCVALKSLPGKHK